MILTKNNQTLTCDYLIIGAGIIGLTLAYQLKLKKPQAKILILEKEAEIAMHASGRNSGVIHAGFYYSAESLKAKFTCQGNQLLKAYCRQKQIPLLECGKVVVAKNETEIPKIQELAQRGLQNGVHVKIIDTQELNAIEANAKTCEIALYSPDTASVNPKTVMLQLKSDLLAQGVNFIFNEHYSKKIDAHTIKTQTGQKISAQKIINAAGLYADKIAKDFDCGHDYTILPFKGIYLKYTGTDQPLKTHIYPVPNLNNPFLGVHFTITADQHLKIGPTAIPAFWRENYQGLRHFKLKEFLQILGIETLLLSKNSFNFRKLALDEFPKYFKNNLIKEAAALVHTINPKNFTTWSTPGIRAQLLNTRSLNLVQDFLTEYTESSIHILNAVSPAFTSSFALSKWIVDTQLN
jgi:L-2-hydroxyglutarate oxidase LhgO